MSKTTTQFICASCGATFSRWQGKCSACGSWNSLSETVFREKGRKSTVTVSKVEKLKSTYGQKISRIRTGIAELDQVLGGGIVPGSVILIGGDPGIGKSTLNIQAAAGIEKNGSQVVYVSGEESIEQVGLRANRLGVKSNNLFFLAETNIEVVTGALKSVKPAVAIIDSIQTMYSDEVMGTAGNIGQVTFCSQRLLDLAKTEKIALIIIGHVTKEGNFAGPKIMEHLVDVVLYLEGDRYGGFRVLKGVKNRFGSTNETGIFEMTEEGMKQISNPSEMLLSERALAVSGTCVFPVLEGRRALLLEVQSLTSVTAFGYPRRTASGIDLNRLQLLIAILAKRVGMNLASQDVFVNIVGGISVKEPAVDLAVILSLASAFKNKKIKEKTIVFGEVGLAGEVRSVNNIEERLCEAEKLGFNEAIVPKIRGKMSIQKIRLIQVETISQAISTVFS